MKNFFKLGFVALALSLSVVACNSEKKAEGADSTAADSLASVSDSLSTAADSTAKAAEAKTK